MMYNVDNCNLFAHSNNTVLTFLESMVSGDGVSSLSFDVTKPECYHSATPEEGF